MTTTLQWPWTHHGELDLDLEPEELRRLKACWNVCQGIETEALERVEGDTTPVFELLMQTTRERDALRTALNNLLNTVNQYDDGEYYLGTDAEQILAEANRVSIETAEPAPPPDTTITTNSVCGKPGHTCNWLDTQPSGSKCTICGETLPF